MITVNRFFAKVRKTDRCWEWVGAAFQNGYGAFWIDGKTTGAHRASYQIHIGEIPQGLEIDHLCKNIKCVNPKHLEVVTKSVNQRRSTSPTGLNAAKTECRNGHPYTEENTYRSLKNDRPARSCRTCRRLTNYRLTHQLV